MTVDELCLTCVYNKKEAGHWTKTICGRCADYNCLARIEIIAHSADVETNTKPKKRKKRRTREDFVLLAAKKKRK